MPPLYIVTKDKIDRLKEANPFPNFNMFLTYFGLLFSTIITYISIDEIGHIKAAVFISILIVLFILCLYEYNNYRKKKDRLQKIIDEIENEKTEIITNL